MEKIRDETIELEIQKGKKKEFRKGKNSKKDQQNRENQ
jgi:hypothetical protein